LVLCQPQALPLLDVKADAVIAIWVLQHVANLAEALAQIKQTMKPDGRLFVVNETAHRFVPTAAGWVDDRLDVSSTLSANLQWIAGDHLSPDVVGDEQSIRTFWAAYAQGE
jgi:ubiquinone/menaquinone biosynthesis C-methylase UbiE